MMQGLIAGWIFLLSIAALYANENLRHIIPTVYGVFLAVAVFTIPILLPILLYNNHKRIKTKKQVEIESFNERYAGKKYNLIEDSYPDYH
jgi:hypothetical protein